MNMSLLPTYPGKYRYFTVLVFLISRGMLRIALQIKG
jgi:hypothetical protein